ncbi:caspase family protein [Halomonas elongata]|uniref:caspase family protein n=1 Tax=Halomonas elongata TaxID=2746 RepID=UPI00255A78A5|nr:caspase family protein [Halomonas elongata]MDL4863210.1 caspase family protein [Halomonas elongata]
MRKALVVGINYYEHVSPLFGCVDDAHAVKAALARNGDGSINFDVQIFTGTGSSDQVTKGQLKDYVEQLFNGDSEIALFYFAGHGYIESTGGYLIGSDCKRGDDGLSLNDILAIANKSTARNKIIILDSCHSGIAGTPATSGDNAVIAEGVTILTASTAEQYATEQDGRGVFTTLFVDALNGVAGNLLGDVSPGGVYAYIDQSLGAWEQRPVFKTNVKSFVSLKKVQPTLQIADLQRLTELFPTLGHEFKLDPTFEPEEKGRDEGMPSPDPENTRTFAILQKFNRVNLVVPVGAPHMWNAAMESKGCRLTVLGEHYRRLVEKGRI